MALQTRAEIKSPGGTRFVASLTDWSHGKDGVLTVLDASVSIVD